MRGVGSIALAAVVAGTVVACTGDTMGAPCEFRLGPLPDSEMPDLDMLVADTVKASLKDYFYSRDCIEDAEEHGYSIFAARSADPAAVAVSIADVTTLEIAAIDVADSVRVTVAATTTADPLPHEFLVRVEAVAVR